MNQPNTYTNMRPETVPLTIFPILLLALAGLMFILAAVLPSGKDSVDTKLRLFSFGLACWIVFVILQLIGGLVK
jgi:hypothetical protein